MVGRVRGNKVEKKIRRKDRKVFGREEGFVKTVRRVHTVYFVIMYCSILTTTVTVSPLNIK
jgi:hypothetical protein